MTEQEAEEKRNEYKELMVVFNRLEESLKELGEKILHNYTKIKHLSVGDKKD